MSRADLANRLGISYAYLGNIQSGRRPIPNRLLSRLDEVLQLKPGRTDELVRAARISDMDPEGTDLLTPILQEAFGDLDPLISEWTRLELNLSAQQILSGLPDPAFALEMPMGPPLSPVTERSLADLQFHVVKLAKSLSLDQLDLVIELLTIARNAKGRADDTT